MASEISEVTLLKKKELPQKGRVRKSRVHTDFSNLTVPLLIFRLYDGSLLCQSFYVLWVVSLLELPTLKNAMLYSVYVIKIIVIFPPAP